MGCSIGCTYVPAVIWKEVETSEGAKRLPFILLRGRHAIDSRDEEAVFQAMARRGISGQFNTIVYTDPRYTELLDKQYVHQLSEVFSLAHSSGTPIPANAIAFTVGIKATKQEILNARIVRAEEYFMYSDYDPMPKEQRGVFLEPDHETAIMVPVSEEGLKQIPEMFGGQMKNSEFIKLTKERRVLADPERFVMLRDIEEDMAKKVFGAGREQPALAAA